MTEQSPQGTEEAPIINFAGELVAVGPLRRDLVPLYQRWINDFSTQRNLAVISPSPVTLDAELGWYDGAAKTGTGTVTFTLYERAMLRPIGTCGLNAIDYRNRTAEFGIMIGEVDARGRGFGTDATRLMLDYAFVALGLNNVMLRVYSYNDAGFHAYRKAGFREFGRRRESVLMGGRFWDIIFMECVAKEFTSPVLAEIFNASVSRTLGE